MMEGQGPRSEGHKTHLCASKPKATQRRLAKWTGTLASSKGP